MADSDNNALEQFMDHLRDRNPGETEYHQAVHEMAQDIVPFIADKSDIRESRVLERLVEPDRVITFRIVWEDDEGKVQINRGYRVQQSSAIGPYKGGIRFHPSVNLSILKFLAFEQVFKNALTGLPLGGGKGGSDFDPKGRSNREVMRFCQAFMTELERHIGPDTDVPAGDIGVGSREVGYLFGQYKRLANRFEGAVTGKTLESGGSMMREAATGYGAVYIMAQALEQHDKGLEGMRCLVSGSGNVALHCADKLLNEGARVLTLSDSGGTLYTEEGLSSEQLQWIQELKLARRGSLSEAADEFALEYLEEQQPWRHEGDLAFPCATQNEIDEDAARGLVKNGICAISEGANMPTTTGAIAVLRDADDVLHIPAKAANAGGVAVSGLEMSQNSQRLKWSEEEVDGKLRETMQHIHALCVEHDDPNGGKVDYLRGANIAAFTKVASAILAQGVL